MRKPLRQVTLKLLVLAVASHSLAAGILLLLVPLWTLKLVGWDYTGHAFWPSQAGLFLALLGVAYASAIRLQALIWFLILSKASAFVFLLSSVVWLDTPKVVVAMAFGDGLMGLSVALALWKQTRAVDSA